jgi:uncharacterized protein (DUF58 family)
MAQRPRLLDLDRLRRYDALALHIRRGMGDRPGERRFPGHPQPTGLEIESYTSYTPGDDLRHLDWNALGRLDTPLIRRFTAEREVLVHLLVDGSGSMDVPVRDGKLAHALELAMVLGYLGLTSNDAVRVALLTGGDARLSPVFRQRPSAAALGHFLAGATAGGALDLGAALGAYARRRGPAGMVVVVSDLMCAPETLAAGLAALRGRGHEVHLLQVVGTGELEPARDFDRGVLQDVETGATHTIVVTAETLARYHALLAEHFAALAALAERTGAGYARVTTGEDVADFVTGALPRLGLVRRR